MEASDCVCLLLHCRRCGTIAVRPLTPNLPSSGLFFPTVVCVQDAETTVTSLISSLRPDDPKVFCSQPRVMNEMLIQVM